MLTVSVAATARRLTTVAAVKSELGDQAAADDFIAAAIDGASGAIEGYCNRVFARETVTETFRLATGTSRLALRRYPVVSIASVVEAGIVLATADYEADMAIGELTRLSSDAETTWPAAKVAVAYTAGYLLPGESGNDLPAEIDRAARLWVKAAWFARGRDPLLRGESVPGLGDQQYWVTGAQGAAAMPGDVAQLLERHRDHRKGLS